MRRYFSLIALAPAFALAQFQSLIVGPKGGERLLLPARHIADGLPVTVGMSPKGRFVAAVFGQVSVADLVTSMTLTNKGPSVPAFRIVVYDRTSHSTEDRGSLPSNVMASEIQPLGDSGTFIAFGSTKESRENVIVLSQPGSTGLRVLTIPQESLFSVDNDAGLWMLEKTPPPKNKSDHPETTADVYTSGGVKIYHAAARARFSLFKGQLLIRPEGQKTASLMDLIHGTVTPFDPQQVLDEKPTPPLLEWDMQGATNSVFSSQGTSKLFCKSGDKGQPYMVAAGISAFLASADGTFITYLDGEAFLIRETIPVPEKMFMDAKIAAERTAVLSRARQVGIALILFASDYDDNLPGGDGWKSKVTPYIKDPDMLKDFVFMLPGVQLSGLKEPASTVLGVLAGPGGQAVVYADGHVKWNPMG